MRLKYQVFSSTSADFIVEDSVFEVGGKNKGQRQIKDIPQGYIVKDDIEIGYMNVIPLWNFGLTY